MLEQVVKAPVPPALRALAAPEASRHAAAVHHERHAVVVHEGVERVHALDDRLVRDLAVAFCMKPQSTSVKTWKLTASGPCVLSVLTT